MQRWPTTGGRTVLAGVLAVVTLLAMPPATRSQAPAATRPAVSDPQENPARTDALPAPEENFDIAINSPGNAGLQPAAQRPDEKPSGTLEPSTIGDEKARLAVNPVTGITVSPAMNFTPLTERERWKLYWAQDFLSMGAYFKPIWFALVLDQTTNSPEQWGGGFAGFGRRVASRLGSNVVQGTIRTPLAAALHEDVRYISDQRGGKRRVLHAVKYSFVTYNDQGHPVLNIAKLVAYYASTAISTQWRPGHHSLASYTFANGSEQLGLSIPVNLLQEFWPDLRRRMSRIK
jgi:hypothetical protein